MDEIDDESRGRLLILDDSGFEEFVDDTGDGEFPSSFQVSRRETGFIGQTSPAGVQQSKAKAGGPTVHGEDNGEITESLFRWVKSGRS